MFKIATRRFFVLITLFALSNNPVFARNWEALIEEKGIKEYFDRDSVIPTLNGLVVWFKAEYPKPITPNEKGALLFGNIKIKSIASLEEFDCLENTFGLHIMAAYTPEGLIAMPRFNNSEIEFKEVQKNSKRDAYMDALCSEYYFKSRRK